MGSWGPVQGVLESLAPVRRPESPLVQDEEPGSWSWAVWGQRLGQRSGTLCYGLCWEETQE